MPTSTQRGESDLTAVPWPDIVKFVRQLSHDIRNNLNAVELQSAYLSELVEEGEIKNEIQRLRQLVSEIGISLQRLTAGLSQTKPVPIAYKAAEFVEDLKQKVATEVPDHANKITWDVQLEDATLQIDPQLVQYALLELFANAFQHERNVKSISARAYIDQRRFVFELREPKTQFDSSTEAWGREPLRNVSPGHYGLGLNRVRSIIESHGGDLHAKYDVKTSMLLTTVTLPAKES